jgi:hypothetical protein
MARDECIKHDIMDAKDRDYDTIIPCQDLAAYQENNCLFLKTFTNPVLSLVFLVLSQNFLVISDEKYLGSLFLHHI